MSSIASSSTPSLASDDSEPTAALPSLAESSSDSEYVAPLSGIAPDPSIDGSSLAGSSAEEGGVRPEKESDVSEDDKQSALRIKAIANKMFGDSKYRQSLDLYTASLNKNPFDAIVWSNRAAARLKMEEYGLAIADATRAIELKPSFVKPYFRRATANLAIMKPKAAVTDLKKVLQLEPNNGPAKQQLEATQKLIRKLQFEAAISSKDDILTSITVSKQLRDGSSPIDKDYTGPRLDANDCPTAEFVQDLLEWFKEGQVVPRRIAWQIVLGAYEILRNEPSMVDVPIKEGQKVVVIGDVHGQFYDFLHLLSLTGRPSLDHTLVFNGDFVDRGSWSTEIILILFAYKWLYPRNVFLNRGNHETADMNKVYGFEGETKKKYSDLTYKLFEEVFTALPLATLITAAKPPLPEAEPNPPNPTLCKGVKRYFVVHGGLFSRDDVTLDEVRAVDRMKLKQPGQEGLMCEMLWTDPQDANGRGPSKRGVGLGFGPDITRKWTERNSITAIIRSHEVRQGGYSVEHNGLCITIFSAPNYVDQVGNLAAFAAIDDTGAIEYTTFSEQPHPPVRPMAYATNLPGMFM